MDEQHRLLIQKARDLSAFIHLPAIVSPFHERELADEELSGPTAKLDNLDFALHVGLTREKFRQDLELVVSSLDDEVD